MRRLLVTGLLCALFAARVWAGTPAPGYSDTLFIGGLSAPTAVAFMPDGRQLVTEKGGALKLASAGSASTLVTIPVCTGSEMGLLGIALDPSFATNGFVYLYRTDSSGGCGSATGRFNQVVRVFFDSSNDTVSILSLNVLLTGIRTDGGNHDGGVLRIGPDGKLYVGVGDTGNGDNFGCPGDPVNPYAQVLTALEGKVLRLNLDGSAPADNPFFAMGGNASKVFARGFRNPFRFSFDPMGGSLWLGDVGDLAWEEVDIVTSGGNYAWPHCEGTKPTGCELAGDVDPIFTYPHPSGSGSCPALPGGSLGQCIIGGSFTGAAFGGQSGRYTFGDCVSSNVYLATLNGTRDGIVGTPATIVTGAGTPADLITGPDGAIYYTAVGAGEVRRVALVSAEQQISGKKILLKTKPPDDTKKRLTVLSKDPTIALGDDPTGIDASLRVVSSTFDNTYPLPHGNWSIIGKPGDIKGYKYKDSLQAAGPTKTANIKAGKQLKAFAKGTMLDHTLGTDPTPVSVELTIGTTHYCMSFGGTTKFVADKLFQAKDAPAPASCPP
jgi:glucose/arabinose dehydrogenase